MLIVYVYAFARRCPHQRLGAHRLAYRHLSDDLHTEERRRVLRKKHTHLRMRMRAHVHANLHARARAEVRSHILLLVLVAVYFSFAAMRFMIAYILIERR